MSQVSSYTISPPEIASSGNVLVTALLASSSVTITAPSGWNTVGSKSGGGSQILLYSHTAGASEPSSYTWNFSSKTECIAMYLEISGVTGRDGTNVDAVANGTSITASSITSTASNDLVVVLCAVATRITTSFTNLTFVKGQTHTMGYTYFSLGASGSSSGDFVFNYQPASDSAAAQFALKGSTPTVQAEFLGGS